MKPPATETRPASTVRCPAELPVDLRQRVGWRGLATRVLEAVSSLPNSAPLPSGKPVVLLTLTTYAYAANILASEDLEAATTELTDLAYLTRGVTVTEADLRNFRRKNRGQIELCLKNVYQAVLSELPEEALTSDIYGQAWDHALQRVQLAVLFDTVMAE